MKKLIGIVAAAFALNAQAQNMEGKVSTPTTVKEGKVIYERTMRLNATMRVDGGNIPPEIQAQLRAQMAKPRVHQFELLFTPQHSLYQFLPSAVEENDGDASFSSGGVNIMMRSSSANEMTYIDYAKGMRLDQREIMEKSFVVEDTLMRVNWKLSEETKPILNFTARKATATSIQLRPRVTMENGEMKREMVNDTIKVIAWYTTDVPVPAGPAYVGQLPGLILELDVNNGQTVTKAIEFSPKVAANKIKEPKDGKKITAAEFALERDKLMQEMRKNMPSGNVIRMQ